MHASIDIHHKQWYDTAVSLGQKVNASPPQLPRRCMQTGRSNTPADTPEMYYKRTVSIPFVDVLLSHLGSRFSNIQQQAVRGMTFVPAVLMDDTLSKPTMDEVIEYYGEDLPSPTSLGTELHLWKCKWRSSPPPLPDTPADALMFANKSMFSKHSQCSTTCVYTACDEL